jgi:hypothetical protein
MEQESIGAAGAVTVDTLTGNVKIQSAKVDRYLNSMANVVIARLKALCRAGITGTMGHSHHRPIAIFCMSYSFTWSKGRKNY